MTDGEEAHASSHLRHVAVGAELAARVTAAQRQLAGSALALREREGLISSLADTLGEVGSLFDGLVSQELRLTALDVVGIVQAERQYKAIKEQTATLNAGQFAMWRQTAEGRVYLAWESAAMSLLRAIEDRDAMVEEAIRQDMINYNKSRPKAPLLLVRPANLSVPEESQFHSISRIEGIVAIAFGLSVVWLIVEIAISLFGAKGLLNNWIILAVVVVLAVWAGALQNSVDRNAFDRANERYQSNVDRQASVKTENSVTSESHAAALASWACITEGRLGVPVDNMRFEWMTLSEVRAQIDSIRQTVLKGREIFPDPASLPALVMPLARSSAGTDQSNALNCLLKAFDNTRGIG